MVTKETLAKLTANAAIKDQYKKQLNRVRGNGSDTKSIETAVEGVLTNLPAASAGSLVVYGDPQSGKTEMMICLTAKLLDAGHRTIVHLMNDSVDLLMQNLDRFKLAGLAPAPRNASDLANSPLVSGHDAVLFCKKNAKDLTKLIQQLRIAVPSSSSTMRRTMRRRTQRLIRRKKRRSMTLFLGSSAMMETTLVSQLPQLA